MSISLPEYERAQQLLTVLQVRRELKSLIICERTLVSFPH